MARVAKGGGLTEMAKVMIVEDEAITAMSIRLKLRSLGYEVCELLSSGEDVLKNMETDKPDLIIMDVGLSGKMNGIQTARKIRLCSTVPIVFITGYFDGELAKEVNKVSASWFLQKPFGPQDIETLAEEILGQHSVDSGSE